MCTEKYNLDHLCSLDLYSFVCVLRHLNERKQKMKEKRRSSEENSSFGLMKGVYNLVMTKNYQ